MRLSSEVLCSSQSKVIFNRKFAKNRYLLRLEASKIAKLASPGQFVQIKLGSYDPLLPRPFAISFADKDFIEILFEIRGKGTYLLSEVRKGDFLTLLGPLGKGFFLPKSKGSDLVLVAGGIGLAPLRFLAWKTAFEGFSITLLYGDKNPNFFLPLEDLLPKDIAIYSIAEEGMEKAGLVTDLLNEVIGKFKLAHYFVCGPKPMLKEVQKLFSLKNIKEAQFSLEEKMGCGYGVCLGCVVLTKDGYKRVCCDGPVFKGDEIKWESI